MRDATMQGRRGQVGEELDRFSFRPVEPAIRKAVGCTLG